jgi:hypothetical protein
MTIYFFFATTTGSLRFLLGHEAQLAELGQILVLQSQVEILATL